MKQTIILLICSLVFSCKSEINSNKVNLSDLNIIIQTDKKIDSVWVANIEQTESFFLPFSDTVKVNFKENLNNLYNISLYTKNGRKSNQLWLNGTHVIVRGQLNKKLEIDTVLNSDLYYTSLSFSKKYNELFNKKADSLTIDNFLLENITKNIQNPFSFDVASPYIYRNQNNKEKIRKLFDILSTQSDTLKNHAISIHGKIENILKVNSIHTENYKFIDIEDKITAIELDVSKTYLLDFWFINCPPCVKDHKLISKKLDFLKEKNVELIGISTDRNHADWKAYLKEHNYNWKNYREVDTLRKLTKDMAIWSFPTYMLLDNNGEIKARFNSFEDFEKTLK